MSAGNGYKLELYYTIYIYLFYRTKNMSAGNGYKLELYYTFKLYQGSVGNKYQHSN